MKEETPTKSKVLGNSSVRFDKPPGGMPTEVPSL